MATLAGNPELAAEADKAGLLQLHHAARRKVSPALLEALLHVHAAAAETADGAGLLPLHWAVSRRAPLPLVEALIQAHTAAAHTADRKGLLPLHHGELGLQTHARGAHFGPRPHSSLQLIILWSLSYSAAIKKKQQTVLENRTL